MPEAKEIHETAISEIATALVLTTTAEATLKEAVSMIYQQHASCLVIVEDLKPIGIITEQDLSRLTYSGFDPDKSVRVIMSTHLISVPGDMKFTEAQAVLSNRGVRHLVIVDDSGRLTGVVTETDFRRYTLKTTQRRLELAMQISGQGYTELNPKTGELWFDEQYEKLLGYEPGELNSDLTTWMQQIHPEDHPSVKEAYQRLLVCDDAIDVEYRRKTKTGQWLWLYSIARVTERDDLGRPARVTGVHMDINERKQTQLKLDQAYEELNQDRSFLKTLINTIPELVWLKDKEDIYLACNAEFERFVGKPEKEIVGRTDYDVIDKELADFFRTSGRLAIETGQPSSNEKWINYASDGHRALLAITKAPMRGADGRLIGVLGIAYDITATRLNEDSLRYSKETLKRAQAVAHIGSWRLDIQANQLEWSDETYRIFGIATDTPLTLTDFIERIHPEDQPMVLETWKTALRGGPYDIQHRILVDNQVLWVRERAEIQFSDTGTPLIGIGTVQEITQQKLTEQALLEGSQRYEAVLSNTIDGFWLVNSQGQLLEVNDAYCGYSGYSRDELLEMMVSDLDPNENVRTIQRRAETIIQTGSEIFEATHRRKDGSLWPVEVSISYSPVQGGSFFSFLRDISERKTAEQISQLRQKLADMVHSDSLEKLLQYALDKAEEITGSKVGFFHFIDENQEAVTQQNWSTRTLREACKAEGEGLHYPVSQAGVWVDCIHQRKPVIHNDFSSLIHKKGISKGHARITRELTVPIFRDDSIVAVIGLGNKQTDYNEQDVSVVNQLADITYDFVERHRAEAKIKFMAFYDVLTGLPNRQLFADRLQQATALHKRSKKLLAIGYLDLDNFKPVNDNFGHQTGDQLLVQVSSRLQYELREGDTLARIGGDEFVVLLGELNNIYQGEEIIKRLLQAFLHHFEVNQHRIYISASIGVTYFPHDNSDPDTLLRHADQAMYKAKQIGKNTYKLFDPIQDIKTHTLQKALTEFEEALQQSQLVLYYQPRIDLHTGELVGVEALVRWSHPEKGLLTPDKFLPLIEGNPLEIALDEWVLKSALDQHLLWRQQGLRITMSVNISPRLIQQVEFPDYLSQLLSSYPDDLASSLELEILETSAIGDAARVAEIMRACNEFGVEFSLDDFGTGYSSLSHFHHLPVSILKIDQHFVREMLINPQDKDIVEGVLFLANILKRPVVAEGVECIEIGSALLDLGCQYAQGYGISRPMPADKLLSWAKQWQGEDEWCQLHLKVSRRR